MTRLDLFGYHLADDCQKVTREMTTVAEDADLLLIEAPEEAPSAADVLGLLVRVPLFACGFALLHVLLYWPLFALFNRDVKHAGQIAAGRLVADADRPIRCVGDGVDEVAGRFGAPFAIANWIGLVGVAAVGAPETLAPALVGILGWVIPVVARQYVHRIVALALGLAATATVVGLLVAGYASAWLLVAGLVALLYGSATTGQERTAAMVEETERIVADGGYERPLLLTTKANLGGVARVARERSFTLGRVHVPEYRSPGETLLEPAPTDLPGGMAANPTPDAVPPEERGVLRERSLAAVADGVLAVAVGVIGSIALGLYARDLAPAVATSERVLWATVAGIAVTPPLYHALLEWKTGTTPGKDGQDLVVVGQNGDPIDARAAVVRNLVRPIDGLGCYAVGWLVATVDDRERRLGDLLAGTVVAKTAAADEAPETAPVEGAAADRDDARAQDGTPTEDGSPPQAPAAPLADRNHGGGGDGGSDGRTGSDGEDGGDETDGSRESYAVDDPDGDFDPWEDA